MKKMKECLYEKIVERKEKIALVGLGYVGMPIAVAFAKKVDVIGFDLNSKKINAYRNSSHAIRNARTPTATYPGNAVGIIIFQNTWFQLQPSTRPASSSSNGTDLKYPFKTQIT